MAKSSRKKELLYTYNATKRQAKSKRLSKLPVDVILQYASDPKIYKTFSSVLKKHKPQALSYAPTHKLVEFWFLPTSEFDEASFRTEVRPKGKKSPIQQTWITKGKLLSSGKRVFHKIGVPIQRVEGLIKKGWTKGEKASEVQWAVLEGTGKEYIKPKKKAAPKKKKAVKKKAAPKKKKAVKKKAAPKKKKAVKKKAPKTQVPERVDVEVLEEAAPRRAAALAPVEGDMGQFEDWLRARYQEEGMEAPAMNPYAMMYKGEYADMPWEFPMESQHHLWGKDRDGRYVRVIPIEAFEDPRSAAERLRFLRHVMEEDQAPELLRMRRFDIPPRQNPAYGGQLEPDYSVTEIAPIQANPPYGGQLSPDYSVTEIAPVQPNPLLMTIYPNPARNQRMSRPGFEEQFQQWVAMKKAELGGMRRNPGSESPFKPKEKIERKKFEKWLMQNGSEDEIKRYRSAMKAYKKFHKGAAPRHVTVFRESVGNPHNQEIEREFEFALGESPAEIYNTPSHSKKAPYSYIHDYEELPQLTSSAGGQRVSKRFYGTGTHVSDWIHG
jgi:hypothetical protein